MPAHLTLDDRRIIAYLRRQRSSQERIAEALERSPSTISRELRRNGPPNEYAAAQAQRHSERRRRNRPVARKMDDPKFNNPVRTGLANGWAPAQIAGRIKLLGQCRCISPQTIYAWIDRNPASGLWETPFVRRGNRQSRVRGPATRSDGARIRNRPNVVERRSRLGDFEGDTVLGPTGTGGLATLVCRKSRLAIIVKVQSKNAEHVHARLTRRLTKLSRDHRRSITFDNGTEFALCHRLESQFGIKLYFADPGCPYQRGTNENTNGLIRQYFPKGTDFRNVSHQAVRQIETSLNNRPRDCLGFRTPAEVFFEKDPPTGCD